MDLREESENTDSYELSPMKTRHLPFGRTADEKHSSVPSQVGGVSKQLRARYWRAWLVGMAALGLVSTAHAQDWTFVQVAAGGYHTLALKRDGTLWAWGLNEDGQLGDGTREDKSRPVQVGTASDWAAVAAGYWHTVALKRDGTLWAWGDNQYGQSGDGTTEDKSRPVQVGTATDWAAVAAGLWHTVALKRDGTL
ncbi:MAG: RCC1 repeat-containing protein, partial [Verrucomicrobia bacterium]|nr:RCC1 repeat-containing protein [Verrucomicrobiota bacterium]